LKQFRNQKNRKEKRKGKRKRKEKKAGGTEPAQVSIQPTAHPG
jgi:hypothetical protein